MPDDIKVPAGVGDDTVAPPVATDLIGGRHFQKIKVGWGADGTWNETDDVAGKRVPIADPVQVAATLTDGATGAAGANGTVVAAAAGLRFLGFAVRETTGTAGATLILRHGTSVAGIPLTIVTLGANESAREWYGPDGIAAPLGVWAERVAGSTQYVVYSKVVP